MKADLPKNETCRLEALHQFQILDTDPEAAYDDITFLASYICETPISTITLIDEKRQWFKSKVGLTSSESSRNSSFCAHAIHEFNLFTIKDAQLDSRFSDNPLVTGDPHIRFYAGSPLVTSDGYALGTLCVIDRRPRELSEEQNLALQALSRQVMVQLEARRNSHALTKLNETLLNEIVLRKQLQKEQEELMARLEKKSV